MIKVQRENSSKSREWARISRHSGFSESVDITFKQVSALEVEQALSGEFE